MKMQVAVFAIASCCALAFAPTAHAMPADRTIDQLKERGFNVQLNGGPSQGTLAQCKVLDVSGLNDSNVDDGGHLKDTRRLTIARVTVACNDTV